MVHGGAWMIGDKGANAVVINKANRWLPKGYVFISVNYRLLPKANPLEQAKDVAKALAAAQAKAKDWGADASRFLLMGHSAGAHLVSLVSADGDMALSQGAKPWLGTVALDSASMDVVQTMEASHRRFYDRVFGSDPAFWREVSPVHRLKSKPVAPFLLVCSSKRDDSCPQAQGFASKISAVGGQATVVQQALSHMEINKQLGTAGGYTDAVESFLRSVGLN
jgi:arylformamidase